MGQNGARVLLVPSGVVQLRRTTSGNVANFRQIRGREIISHTQTENRHTGRCCSASSACKNINSIYQNLLCAVENTSEMSFNFVLQEKYQPCICIAKTNVCSAMDAVKHCLEGMEQKHTIVRNKTQRQHKLRLNFIM